MKTTYLREVQTKTNSINLSPIIITICYIFDTCVCDARDNGIEAARQILCSVVMNPHHRPGTPPQSTTTAFDFEMNECNACYESNTKWFQICSVTHITHSSY